MPGRSEPAAEQPPADLREPARQVLAGAWDPTRGYCVPNAGVYPHLWLWDSCFHAIAWLAVGDARWRTELTSVFAGARPDGFLPHMRYRVATYRRGPRADVSSFTQPPVYVEALARAAAAGHRAGDLMATAERCLDALWRRRMHDGLLVLYHPWESGADDSPRWDSWVLPMLPAGAPGGPVAPRGSWRQADWRAADRQLLDAVGYDTDGVAVGSTRFVAAPAAFNAIAAWAADTLGDLLDHDEWRARGSRLAEAVETLWSAGERLWDDRAVLGGGPSVTAPTLDGVLPALCSRRPRRCRAALDQLRDPTRFAARYGPAYVARAHPGYDPVAYWRGPAWPQLGYLLVRAAARCGEADLAAELADATRRGVLRSGWAEYWDPETGAGLGARPQTWSAVAAALD